MESFFIQWLKAWSLNDVGKLCEFYAEDVFYSDPHYPKGIN